MVGFVNGHYFEAPWYSQTWAFSSMLINCKAQNQYDHMCDNNYITCGHITTWADVIISSQLVITFYDHTWWSFLSVPYVSANLGAFVVKIHCVTAYCQKSKLQQCLVIISYCCCFNFKTAENFRNFKTAAMPRDNFIWLLFKFQNCSKFQKTSKLQQCLVIISYCCSSKKTPPHFQQPAIEFFPLKQEKIILLRRNHGHESMKLPLLF